MNNIIAAASASFLVASKIKAGQAINVDVALQAFNAVEWLNLAPEQVKLAQYALAALIDEMALTSPTYREQWSQNPLQLQLFGLNLAGEEFFTYLNQLRYDPIANLELLELYLLVLRLGYKGKYLNQEKILQELIDNITQQIDACKLSGYQLKQTPIGFSNYKIKKTRLTIYLIPFLFISVGCYLTCLGIINFM